MRRRQVQRQVRDRPWGIAADRCPLWVTPLRWYRAHALAKAEGLPVRRNKLAIIDVGGRTYEIKLASRVSAECPLEWWVQDNHSTQLLLRATRDGVNSPSASRRSTLTWTAHHATWPPERPTTHATAAAAVADLMDRHWGKPGSSAQWGLLAAVFGGASSEHLKERCDAVLEELSEADDT